METGQRIKWPVVIFTRRHQPTLDWRKLRGLRCLKKRRLKKDKRR